MQRDIGETQVSIYPSRPSIWETDGRGQRLLTVNRQLSTVNLLALHRPPSAIR